ncbi:OmpA family protein [Allofrancisella guangzhouensis]|uniref:Membrane protein n=1 Tax=Allofrancisella guangzhouensis TaxID=594679 RepID=L8BT08_9GAMM|nr:OmpA family protein [Allofrancisella guangzhouensis]AJC48891.1 membrane protein [Allofrancisella guangzhouensis]MBK2027432.1 OmpA family protein [Allofrancisella guangzhouensis]MBK2043418.1 OmpA family protein [Allofrancisella guangzhouensis]MBK2045843.1 OmpA family protein [Allofrancisella guangzhouensis]CCO62154.1 outer membrane protein A fopA precursor [Allofrancisella guangzhouensis]
MKLKNIVVAMSMLFGTATMTFADVAANATVNDSFSTDTSISSTIMKPFANTWSSITNENNTWGPQDRSGQWYLGVGVSGFANNMNSKGSNSGWNGIVGYNFNKYLAVQYNQFATYNGMFGGLGEGVINLTNNTMFTPYAVGGAGWANLAGRATGAWDVGGGLKFELSRDVQASVDYRYIQTMAPNPISGGGQQINAAAGTNMIGAGLTWFFGGNSAASASTANIKDDGAKIAVGTGAVAAVSKVDEAKYVLPKGIKQCEGNFNLTKDGVACYTVDGDDVTVYLDTKFAYDSAELNQKGKEAISSFVGFIKDSNIASVTIKGYASQGQTGGEFEVYNQKLSEKRAIAVASYMRSLGLDKEKIITKGFGYYDTLPGVDKSDKSNQRVQASVSAPLK